MSTLPLPGPVADALRGRPTIGASEAASLLITNKSDGFPHVTLLSRAELEVGADGRLLVALAGSTTPANLDRVGQATLLVIVDDTAHSCDLRVAARLEGHGMVGYVLEPVHLRADSLGIPLTPIRYTTPPELPSIERWDASGHLLAELAELP